MHLAAVDYKVSCIDAIVFLSPSWEDGDWERSGAAYCPEWKCVKLSVYYSERARSFEIESKENPPISGNGVGAQWEDSSTEVLLDIGDSEDIYDLDVASKIMNIICGEGRRATSVGE